MAPPCAGVQAQRLFAVVLPPPSGQTEVRAAECFPARAGQGSGSAKSFLRLVQKGQPAGQPLHWIRSRQCEGAVATVKRVATRLVSKTCSGDHQRQQEVVVVNADGRIPSAGGFDRLATVKGRHRWHPPVVEERFHGVGLRAGALHRPQPLRKPVLEAVAPIAVDTVDGAALQEGDLGLKLPRQDEVVRIKVLDEGRRRRSVGDVPRRLGPLPRSRQHPDRCSEPSEKVSAPIGGPVVDDDDLDVNLLLET